MPAVTFDGTVAERTIHLRYFGIHFNIMLTYRKHVETTTLRCKKGLSVLVAIAAKVIEPNHLFLLYQNVVLSVTDNNGTNKSVKAGQSAEQVILGTTKDTIIETMRFMLDLPPMQTRQSRTGQSIFQCRQKSTQPTP